MFKSVRGKKFPALSEVIYVNKSPHYARECFFPRTDLRAWKHLAQNVLLCYDLSLYKGQAVSA